MAVTKRARYEVFRRDGHRCTYCCVAATGGAKLTIDHVIAEQKALGAKEEREFVHAVADLMPLAMRTRGKFISVPTQGEASLRELSRRHAAGDLAGDIDVLSWAGAPF